MRSGQVFKKSDWFERAVSEVWNPKDTDVRAPQVTLEELGWPSPDIAAFDDPDDIEFQSDGRPGVRVVESHPCDTEVVEVGFQNGSDLKQCPICASAIPSTQLDLHVAQCFQDFNS